MKFDHTIGNPPYQKQVGPDKTEQIWPTLVLKFESLLKKGGDYNMIHPGNWKTSNKKEFLAVKKMYETNNVTHIEFNDYAQGQKTFGATTDYDVVSMINEPNKGKTIIVIDSEIVEINLSEYEVIPTKNLKEFQQLKALPSEEKVKALHSRSAYGSDKTNTSSTKDSEFKFPCVYGFPEKGIKYFYSNTNDKGHFGVSKLILARASATPILDLDGEFGMTQFAHAIVDTEENLIKLEKVIESKWFRHLKSDFCGLGESINKNAIIDSQGNMFKFIKEFRKDWWKDLYTEEMEQELIKEGKISR